MKHVYVFLGIAFLSALLLSGCIIFNNDDECNPCDSPGIPPTPFYEAPRWSPDGSEILYYSFGLKSYNEALDEYEIHPDSIGIWVMEADGRNRRWLLGANYADWSPGGDWIVFGVGAHIFKIAYDGETVDPETIVQLTTEGRNFFPEWSPDGKYITYDRSIEDESGPAGIWKMDINGDNKRALFGGAHPTWSPESEHIAAVRHRTLQLYDLESASQSTIVNFEELEGSQRYPKFSPVDNRVVIQSNRKVHIIDVDTGGMMEIGDGFYPDWSPDGSQIVYICTGICVMNADGSDIQLISKWPRDEEGL